jgi:UDP-N-acetylglucosamine acyltransferase
MTGRFYVHPTAVVETDDIGEGTFIGPFCLISRRVRIGRNCMLRGHCSIGQPPQYKTPPEDEGGMVVIDDGVEIREFVTVNLPSQRLTYVGKNAYLQANCHIPHDAHISDDAFVVVGAALAGFTHIGRHCYLGLNCSTHQRARLEDYCLLGANSFFRGESPPGIIWAGVPARPIKVNEISIGRHAPDGEKDLLIKRARDFIKESKKQAGCA